MNGIFQRSWISPFIAFTFILMSITGILMFFHLRGPSINLIHEWSGIAFAVGAVIHALINLKVLIKYFSRPSAIAVFVFCALLLIAIVFGPKPPPEPEKGNVFRHGPHGEPDHGPMMMK